MIPLIWKLLSSSLKNIYFFPLPKDLDARDVPTRAENKEPGLDVRAKSGTDKSAKLCESLDREANQSSEKLEEQEAEPLLKRRELAEKLDREPNQENEKLEDLKAETLLKRRELIRKLTESPKAESAV